MTTGPQPTDRSAGGRRPLGRTDLHIAPLVLGGNVFGWTADQNTAFAILDRFTDAGLNAVDTADSYSTWVPGHQGGESETMLGDWMASRSRRHQTVVITKVGSRMGPDRAGLAARYIASAAEDSLRRLRTDYLDLYLSHWPDPATPWDETLRAYQLLLESGKVRAIGASNLDATQLQASLNVALAQGLPRYDVLQPEYNLADRSTFEGPLADLCVREEIGVISYYALAKGFLTGKYRSEADLGQSPRGGGVAAYLTPRGNRILAALDQVAAAHAVAPAAVALAWVAAQRGVTAPIASATSVAQVETLIASTRLALTADELALLTAAGSD